MSAMTRQRTVGDLVKARPARSRVFERLNIDYCCGGRLPLAEACAKRGLDADRVLDQLRADDADDQTQPHAFIDADAMGLAKLTTHIEETHHAYLRAELPRLAQMVRKVAAVHGDRYPWMLEVDGVFCGLVGGLESHTIKEEQRLFPLIRCLDRDDDEAIGSRRIAAIIEVMEHEHDDAGASLERLRNLTSNYTPPPDACNTFRAMLDGLAQLEIDLHQHVHKENNVLFPKALAREASLDSKHSAA